MCCVCHHLEKRFNDVIKVVLWYQAFKALPINHQKKANISASLSSLPVRHWRAYTESMMFTMSESNFCVVGTSYHFITLQRS